MKWTIVLAMVLVVACVEEPTASSEVDASLSLAGADEATRYVVTLNSEVTDVPSFLNAVAPGQIDSLRHIYRHAIKGFAGTMRPSIAAALAKHPAVKAIAPDVWVADDGVAAASPFGLGLGRFPGTSLSPLEPFSLASNIGGNSIAESATALRNWPLATRSGIGWGLGRIDDRLLTNDAAYSSYSNGLGVNIYIVDSGIDIAHPEFGGRAFAAYSSVVDDDPWLAAGKDCNGHGTAVASVAGGSTIGVANGATLWDVRTKGCFGAWMGDRIAGIDWVVGHHVDPAVMNISFGLRKLEDQVLWGSLGEAVKAAINAGVITVVSAGNDNEAACDHSPAHVPGAITVGATNFQDGRYVTSGNVGSNHGICLDIFAPGQDVMAAVTPTATAGASYSLTPQTGTSLAAPYVTGVIAMILQRNPSASITWATHLLSRSSTLNKVTNPGNYSTNRLLYSHHTFVHITGDRRITEPGHYNWLATGHGGNGSYQIRWDLSMNGGQTYITVGYGSSYGMQVYDGDPNFIFRVVLTSGVDSFTEPYEVEVCMGGGTQFCGS